MALLGTVHLSRLHLILKEDEVEKMLEDTSRDFPVD